MCNQLQGESYIWCQAPQLFTDKSDKLGYCIIEIEDDFVNRVIYREWFESRNCFKIGLDFTDSEDGIVEIDNNRHIAYDPIRSILEANFREAMCIYGDSPLVWINRFFSLNRFDRVLSFNQKDLFSEDDIIGIDAFTYQDTNSGEIMTEAYDLIITTSNKIPSLVAKCGLSEDT